MSGSVGVVIPAYKARRFLAQAIESVLAQSCAAAAIVVVDDGSPDDSAAVAASFGPRVRCVRQANAGVAAARNRGVRELATDWVAFLDADDLWRGDKLARQLEAGAAAGAEAVFCSVQLIDEEGRAMEVRRNDTALDIEALLFHHETIPQATSSTILVTRRLFESVGGYDERLATMADWDLLIRLRLQARFAHVPLPLAAYRRYAGTMSRNVDLLERESQLVLAKTFSVPGLDPRLRRLERRCQAWNDLVLSGSHLHDGHLRAAWLFGLRAIVRDPLLLSRALGAPWRMLKRRVAGIDRRT